VRPYGVPYAVTLAAEIIFPLLSIEAITVAPYLNTSLPPDSSMVKLVVSNLGVLAAVPVVFWFSVGNVQLVKLPEDGVPNAGVTNAGLVARTTSPVPVDVVTPVPPRATERVPVVPVKIGNPVAFAKLMLEGVPKAGVTSVGLFDRTTSPVPVDVVTPVPPRATDKVPVVPVRIGSPVALVSVTLAGVPKVGLASVGLCAKTTAPEPVEVVPPVPPLATASVPARVIAPDVASEGDSPVVPALKDVTPADMAPI